MIARVWRRLEFSIRRNGLWGTIRLIPKAVAYFSVRLFRRGDEFAALDQELGIRTGDIVEIYEMDLPPEAAKESHRYEAVGGGHFLHIIDTAAIEPADFTFIDIGSGKGRAIVLAGRMPFKHVIGVELFTQLHDVAQANMEAQESAGALQCGSWELCNESALDFPYANGPLFIFMNNPFHGSTLRQCFEQICALPGGRDIIIAYVNPRHLHQAEGLPFDTIHQEDTFCLWKVRQPS